jgi:hypothetical protein
LRTSEKEALAIAEKSFLSGAAGESPALVGRKM